MRRIAMLAALTLLAASGAGPAAAQPADDACAAAAPSAAVCIGAQKPVEAAAATCRMNGGPEAVCAASPYGHVVRPSALEAYRQSWVHRTAQFQFALGNALPLRDAQWLGTHNSFNTDANGPTLSHTDSNQGLTLTEQLDGDIRAIELDVHLVPGGTSGGIGSRVVRVCHGRGADQYHAGCTTEPLFADVIPEVKAWLAAHPRQVILLYLEDNVQDAAGYEDVVSALGSDLVYHPEPARSQGCTELPLSLTRDAVLAAGRRIVAVGNCAAGWSGSVYGWNATHVESGSTPGYRAPGACDATYGRDVYAGKLVRYFEDSTWLSAAVDPTQTPADHEANALTPQRVAWMTACGVNLFGFDQFDPTDGRVEASLWSWAKDMPDSAAGDCAAQRASDGRWVSVPCIRTVRPAACRTASGWRLSPAVAAAGAAAACSAAGGRFDPPRSGEENTALRAAAGDAEPWVNATA